MEFAIQRPASPGISAGDIGPGARSSCDTVPIRYSRGMMLKFKIAVVCLASTLTTTSALSAGWGYSVYGASPDGDVVVPLNTKIWVMDNVDYESDDLPNLTECDDPNGDLVDCTGRLHSLTLLGTRPALYGSILRLYQGENITLQPDDTIGYWVTDINSLMQEVRWTVSSVEDVTPPPSPEVFSASSGFDFDDGSSSPTDIPAVITWRSMTLTSEGDDFGVAYLEIQTEDGTVVGWSFKGPYSNRFSWTDPLGTGPYRAIAVDYAGNRSVPSELITVPGQPDPYVASCLEGYIYNEWCYIMFPELLGEEDAGPAGSASNGDDAGPGTERRVVEVRCSCNQKSARPLPLLAILILLLPVSLRTRRSTQKRDGA